MKRVLYVITTLDVGGAEKHLLWLIAGLKERGIGADVVYLKGEGSLAPQFEALGCRVEKVAFESPKDAPRAVRAIAAKIRGGGYDVVHSHLLKADALTALASRLARPKALVTTKHNEEQVLRKLPVSLVHGLLSRAADRIIALSEHVKEYVATTGRAPRDRIVRVYYGIDAGRFEGGDRARARAALGVRDSTHVALCVARFHPQKDHPTLFRAVDRLRRAGRDVKLWLAGGDPFYGHQQRLEAVVREMDLERHVAFLGIRSDVKDLLAACDAFALPSVYEGLGLVYLEAMAASKPVLATNGSAIPEVVSDGVTGELVTVGDDAALAAAWGRLIDDPSRAATMGRAGRERVERLFTLPRMIDETLAVYEAARKRA